MIKRTIKGKLEIICGSMFSGKSEELIRRVRRAEFAQQKVCVFKHRVDDRMSIDYIHAHNGDKYKAIALENPNDMLLFVTEEVKLVAIDEVQFFDSSIISTILDMIESGKRVVAAGLDLDFRGIPFGPIPTLLAVANTVTKLTAVCMTCGNDAHFSQRLINGRAAKFDDPLILIGAQDCYQARCRDCYMIDRPAWKQVQAEV
jgi:thymidine kinase